MDPRTIELSNLRVLNDYLNQTIEALIRGPRGAWPSVYGAQGWGVGAPYGGAQGAIPELMYSGYPSPHAQPYSPYGQQGYGMPFGGALGGFGGGVGGAWRPYGASYPGASYPGYPGLAHSGHGVNPIEIARQQQLSMYGRPFGVSPFGV